MIFLDNNLSKRSKKTSKYLNSVNLDLDFFLEMVSYRRKQGSLYQKKFCNRYLLPVFGSPDRNGNYTLIIGDKPSVAFMAHHDTVHSKDGKVKPDIVGDFVVSSSNDVLGADCTTGIFLILRMIKAKVPGVYVVHSAEEIGCIGSRALVADKPIWLNHVKAAISLDRKGYTSIITHQMGMRTCSEEFSKSLNNVLDGMFESDSGGSYTDSNEYSGVIPECTNLSVGYFDQHTKNESQDWVFMMALADMLVSANWDNLVISRDPTVIEYDDTNTFGHNYYTGGKAKYKGPKSGYVWGDWSDIVDEKPYGQSKKHGLNMDRLEDIEEVVQKYPLQIAKLLLDMGYTADGLMDDVADYLNERTYY